MLSSFRRFTVVLGRWEMVLEVLLMVVVVLVVFEVSPVRFL
jgi:hypothetical protein